MTTPNYILKAPPVRESLHPMNARLSKWAVLVFKNRVYLNKLWKKFHTQALRKTSVSIQ